MISQESLCDRFRVGAMFSALVTVVASVCWHVCAASGTPQSGYTREQLQPLTKFRQQHQRTIDGRLCAAAFVQARKAYTGCTDAPDPSGMSGRPWCYVEPQVGDRFSGDCFRVRYARFVELVKTGDAWNYCGARRELVAECCISCMIVVSQHPASLHASEQRF